jgi:ribosomal-protein-alanine N-acetyltransferase
VTPPARGAAPLRVVLRPMVTRDLTAVRRIERAAYTDAWSRRVFEQELRNGFAHYFVAEVQGRRTRGERGLVRRVLAHGGRPPLAGFAGVWFMGDQVHVVTVATDPKYEGRGLGARLLLECFAQAREAEMDTLALEVRVSNDRARALYERYGFRVAGRLRGYYQDDGEDAFVMVTPSLGRAFLRRIDALRQEHRERFPGLWLGETSEAAG